MRPCSPSGSVTRRPRNPPRLPPISPRPSTPSSGMKRMARITRATCRDRCQGDSFARHRAPHAEHAACQCIRVGPRSRPAAAPLSRAARESSSSRSIDGSDVMIYYYLERQLYGLDRPELDTRVLQLLRHKWQPMVASRWQCSWESMGGGSQAHIYGMFSGYFLSAYVLGVSRNPAGGRKETFDRATHSATLRRRRAWLLRNSGR